MFTPLDKFREPYKNNNIPMKTAIVFPVFNCLEYTKQALESVVSKDKHLVIIIDNGSTDGTKEFCESYEPLKDQGFKYVRHEENTGVAAAWNEGIAKAIELHPTIEYVLVSNNDVILHPKTIDNMIDSLDRHEDWGMVTASNQRAVIQEAEAIKVKEIEIPAESFSEGPDFGCFMIRKSAYDKVGKFDEGFVLGFFEDNDYHFRMKKLAIPAMTTTLCPYYHFGSRTQNQKPGGIVDGKQFDRNRQYYVQKHGGGVGSEQW